MYTMILLFLVTNGSREEFIKRNKNILDMSNYPELCKKIGIDPNENKMKPGWLKSLRRINRKSGRKVSKMD
jgi:hypothetical protein